MLFIILIIYNYFINIFIHINYFTIVLLINN